jgi:hypothetical protein
LLLGEGEPFGKGNIQIGKISSLDYFSAIDPVEQLLNEEEKRAGIILTPDQRNAILKIFRELVEKDIRAIRELLRSFPGKQAP